MGVLTLTQLRSAAHLALNQRSDLDPTVSANQTLWNRWINEAYRHICLPSVFEHPAMQKSDTITLADGTDSYSLPSDLFSISFVINETSSHRYNPEQARELLNPPTSDTYRYARWGNTIRINVASATDGDTVRIYYWARPTIFSTDAQVSEIEEYWDEVIWTMAAQRACRNLALLERADFFAAEGANLINDAAEAKAFEAHDRGWRNSPTPMAPRTKTR